jgi:acetyl-CoA/propionyl-CoA carboxylase biotin carboxyl carrier protein
VTNLKKLVNGQIHEFEDDANFETRQTGDLVLIKTPEGRKSAAVVKTAGKTLISFRGRQYTVSSVVPNRKLEEATGSGELKAPLPGVVVAVRGSLGDLIKSGTAVVVIEAMKTQIPILAPFDSILEKLLVSVGQAVKAHELLAVLEKAANT